ncbi:hypothetical protein A3203_19655 [Burkholderia cenocepacia]|nr:hypothetical protein A3203_19655 [Burkholderia cenocepacia]DAH71654.1 MAG TPA: hypothetical protein [Caudoviricetes sp.]
MDRLDILCQPWTDVCRIRADLSADRKKGAHIQRDDAAQVLADESLCAEARCAREPYLRRTGMRCLIALPCVDQAVALSDFFLGKGAFLNGSHGFNGK